MTKNGYVLRDNLIMALRTAIRHQEVVEKKMGYTGDSAMVGGWKDNLKILESGGFLTIRESPPINYSEK
jgi:hypothetical protein